jgi:SAM-dependent methyltransferase
VSDPRRLYSTIEPKSGVRGPSPAGRMHALEQLALAPVGLAAGILCGAPGIRLRLRLARLALRGLAGGTLAGRTAYELLVRPLDSVRHFELEFCRDLIRERDFSSYLDVSSPRLLPLTLLTEMPKVQALLCNPDRGDLDRTRTLARELGIGSRVEFAALRIEELALRQPGFELLTCVSVIEHIPGGGDAEAFRQLWDMVQPGGRLVITVPCAAEHFEEYLNLDEYGLAKPEPNGFFFGQRFYSRTLLAQRLFAVAGQPAAFAVFGERTPGIFFADRARRLRDGYYPHWREPIMMRRGYRTFAAIDDLPGIGVAAMVFEKR